MKLHLGAASTLRKFGILTYEADLTKLRSGELPGRSHLGGAA
jgi:hypothetical protein